MSFTSSNNTARRGNTIYAIAFDLDVEMLSKSYGNQNYNNAYNDIKNTLAQYGFVRHHHWCRSGRCKNGDSNTSISEKI